MQHAKSRYAYRLFLWASGDQGFVQVAPAGNGGAAVEDRQRDTRLITAVHHLQLAILDSDLIFFLLRDNGVFAGGYVHTFTLPLQLTKQLFSLIQVELPALRRDHAEIEMKMREQQVEGVIFA